MIQLLIIADDVTGAFDTGIQFAVRGAKTIVTIDPAYDFQTVAGTVDVLVMVAETRHLQPSEANEMVFDIVRRARGAGIASTYKKTDSVLRGNIGSELTALMDAAEIDRLAFVPALPRLGRVTRGGIHYIDGIPVAQSLFGQDPFEPVIESEVAKILSHQTSVVTKIHTKNEKNPIECAGIHVFDAETNDDLRQIGRELGLEQLQYCAGCAGFAGILAELMYPEKQAPVLPEFIDALFITCGSMHPVTREQIRVAEEQGFLHIHLNTEQKLDEQWITSKDAQQTCGRWVEQVAQKRRFILDANQLVSNNSQQELTSLEQRERISDNLAAITKNMLDCGLEATLLCTGGDTLVALMRAVGVTELSPMCEMAAGVVLTELIYHDKSYQIISKSGGFGEANLFVELGKTIFNHNRR